MRNKNTYTKVKNKKQKGLTLVELLITVAVMGLIMVSVSSTLTTGFQTYAANRRVQEHQVQARFALLALSRDIHMATGQITVAANNSYIIIPVSPDGQTEPSRFLRYTLVGNELERTWHSTPTGPVLTGSDIPANWPVRFVGSQLRGFSVARVNSDGAPATVENDGHWISIVIDTAPDPSGQSITISSTISTQRLLPHPD